MSVIKHKEQRVGIFIDTQNLYHSAKNLYHARVNFGQMVKDALDGRSLIRAVAYVITTESGEEKNFFEALSKIGIETKTKVSLFGGLNFMPGNGPLQGSVKLGNSGVSLNAGILFQFHAKERLGKFAGFDASRPNKRVIRNF